MDVTLRGLTTSHSYTVGASDSLAHIAQKLADSINATGADVFSAVADGNILVIVNRDGSTFATGLKITTGAVTVDAGGVQVIDRSTPTEAMMNLDGKPAAGEVWQVTLDDGSTTPAVLRYTVGVNDTLATIAAGLAAAINGSALVDPAFVAVAEGDSLVIVNRDGTLFSATPEVQPAGQPGVNEDWTVTLQSATSGLLTFTYTTVAGDTRPAWRAHCAVDQHAGPAGVPGHQRWRRAPYRRSRRQRVRDDLLVERPGAAE